MHGGSDGLIREMSIEIWAPPEKVWEMLALDRWAEYDEGTQKMVKRVEYTSEVSTPRDKYRVGATANLIGNNDKLYLACEVMESLENEKISYRLNADHWVSQISQTFVLEPIEKGTKLTCVINIEKISWGILGKTLIKLITRGNGAERVLENLKSILEK